MTYSKGTERERETGQESKCYESYSWRRGCGAELNTGVRPFIVIKRIEALFEGLSENVFITMLLIGWFF